MTWTQTYDQFASPILSLLGAALPVVLQLVLLASGRAPAPVAAPFVAVVGFAPPEAGGTVRSHAA